MQFKIFVENWNIEYVNPGSGSYWGGYFVDNRVMVYDSMSVESAQLIKNPVLSLELNHAGQLVYSVPPVPSDNPALSIPAMKAIFVVERDGVEIWRGRKLSEEVDIEGIKTVTCEGELAFLNDICVRPYKYTNGASIQTLFNMYVNTYNNNASSYRKIYPGNVYVTAPVATTTVETTEQVGQSIEYLRPIVDQVINGDWGNGVTRKQRLEAAGYDYNLVQDLVNKTIYGQPIQWTTYVTITKTVVVYDTVENQKPGSVLNEINNELLDVYGGYLRLRRANNKSYLDYIVDFDSTSTNGLFFDRNILEYSESFDASDVYTKAIVYGKSKDDGTYYKAEVTDSYGVSLYGVIENVLEYSDIDDPAKLRSLGLEELTYSYIASNPITIRAIDLALFYTGEKPIEVGDVIPITLEVQNRKLNVQCSSAIYYMNSPENNEYTFGDLLVGFTEMV